MVERTMKKISLFGKKSVKRPLRARCLSIDKLKLQVEDKSEMKVHPKQALQDGKYDISNQVPEDEFERQLMFFLEAEKVKQVTLNSYMEDLERYELKQM